MAFAVIVGNNARAVVNRARRVLLVKMLIGCDFNLI